MPPSTTWYSGGHINAIWGWQADINAKAPEVASNQTAVDVVLKDTIISCSPYQADECNCVYYARDRQPKLPSGLSTCDDKKNTVNSHTAKAGCVLFRTGDPT